MRTTNTVKPIVPKTIAIAANVLKSETRQRLQELLQLLESNKVRVLLEDDAASLVNAKASAGKLGDFARNADLLIVLGGDGTILRAARALNGVETPILGVNLGGLGFLTSIRSTDLTRSMENILRGQYDLSARHTLQTRLMQDGREVKTHLALNDAVISRSTFSRVVRLILSIDGESLTEYVCDGMIFATATGSTAYSLSAGGPILLPSARSFIVTPICPHALSDRSIIAGEHSVVDCRVAGAAGDLLLTVDGHVQAPMHVGDSLQVRQAPGVVYLVAPKGHSHFEVLRQKLKWSGGNV